MSWDDVEPEPEQTVVEIAEQTAERVVVTGLLKERRRNNRLAIAFAFWALVISGIALIAVNNSSDGVSRATTAGRNATSAVQQVQQGRHASLGVTCVVLNAIAETGRRTIAAAEMPGDSLLTRNLEALGLPPASVRNAAALAASQAYVRSISKAVRAKVGGKNARKLINRDGTINCKQFAGLARTGA